MTENQEPSKERGCEGKMKSYGFMRSQVKAEKLKRKYGKEYGVYGCPHCAYYHFTTKLENSHLYPPMNYRTDGKTTDVLA